MRIDKLTIINFRSIERFEFDSNSLMNVFIGNNGSGKSSVLRAIRILYSWFAARLRNPKGNGEVISYDDIRRGADYSFLSIEVTESGRKVAWQLYRPQSTFREQTKFKTDLSGMTEFVSSLAEGNAQHWPMMSFYEVSRSISNPPLRIRKRHKLEAMDLYDKDSIGAGTNFNAFFRWFREKEDIENQMRLDSDPAYRDSQLECIRKSILSVFSDFSGFRVNRHNKSFEITKKGEVFRFSQLSDGEKCYLGLVMDIARVLAITTNGAEDALESENVIVIDELDLHLHPWWQAGVMGRLKRVFPHCQFFITTHSPYILSELDTNTGNLFVLEDGNVSRTSDNPYGRPVDGILLQDFGQRTLRNPHVTKLLEEAWGCVREGATDGEKFESLLQELQDLIPGDIEIVRIDHARRRRHEND